MPGNLGFVSERVGKQKMNEYEIEMRYLCYNVYAAYCIRQFCIFELLYCLVSSFVRALCTVPGYGADTQHTVLDFTAYLDFITLTLLYF